MDPDPDSLEMLDPDPDSLEMLDQDQDSFNPDPQLCREKDRMFSHTSPVLVFNKKVAG